MLDVFHDDAFSVVNLTNAINNIQFVPGYLTGSGLFTETGVSSPLIAIETRNDMLELIPPTPRGGPGVTLGKNKRGLKAMVIPHFEINDAIYAAEVDGVRAFGSENSLETVMGKVAERMSVHQNSHAATQEFARVGAVIGLITYADSTTLNLFTEFGVSQENELDFSLDDKKDGALRAFCAGIIRTMAENAQGMPFSGVESICGDKFFDDLIANPEVRATYLQTQSAADLRTNYVTQNGQVFGRFTFGDITWTNYRGKVGNTSFVNTDKCHLYPVGAPGLFQTYYAPADYTETVNTIGISRYVKQYDMPNGKGVNFDSQTNPLHICLRPKVLMKGKRV